MEIIIVSIALFGLVLLANWLAIRAKEREIALFHWLLLLLNVPILVIGGLLWLSPPDSLGEFPVDASIFLGDLQSIGLVLILTAIWGMVVCLYPVRKLITQWMPLDSHSPVHTLALVFAGYLVGQGALAMTQGGLQGLADTLSTVSIGLFVVSELVLAVLAFLGIGWLVRRNGRELFQRMGLKRVTAIQLLIGASIIVILVVFQALAGLIWALINPEQAELLENVNSLLLGDIDTIGEWFLLALAAGLGEELLFRGALQPVLGLGFTAVLFGLVHVQYGFSPIILVLIILAVILGIVRQRYSTTLAILIHFGYNFTLGLLALLATYLERFVV